MSKIVAMFLILLFTAGVGNVHAAEVTESPAVPETDAPAAMTFETMEKIISVIDKDYQREGNVLGFVFREMQITIVTDVDADRMRVVIPVMEVDDLPEELWKRLMQANFDSALDARYAVAQNILWSTFIHRLSTLTKDDFLSGIGQSINIVLTFGSTFTSGEMTFGGGDSNAIHRELIDELLKRGDAI